MSNSLQPRKFHDVVQNSDEWHALRIGKVTSSNFDVICANMGKSFGDPAMRYARKKALERITGRVDDRGDYKNSFMQDGHENEPVAAGMYQIETFNDVTNGGFTEWGLRGDSPDGFVGSDGCIEIKCVIANTHWDRLEKGAYDTSYKWQIQGHLWISDRQWCDFVQFCPEFPEHKQLYHYRVERDEEMIEALEARLQKFEAEIGRLVEFISNKGQ